MEPDSRWRSPGPSNWYSPRYRGGGYRANYQPRHRGNTSWQYNRSPGNYGHSSTPYSNAFYEAPFSSSPRQPHWKGYRPQRKSFRGSPHQNRSFEQSSIESWVSPQMWEDPWKDLISQYEPQSRTKFADTDFSLSANNSHSDNKDSSVATDSAINKTDSIDVEIFSFDQENQSKSEEVLATIQPSADSKDSDLPAVEYDNISSLDQDEQSKSDEVLATIEPSVDSKETDLPACKEYGLPSDCLAGGSETTP